MNQELDNNSALKIKIPTSIEPARFKVAVVSADVALNYTKLSKKEREGKNIYKEIFQDVNINIVCLIKNAQLKHKWWIKLYLWIKTAQVKCSLNWVKLKYDFMVVANNLRQ